MRPLTTTLTAEIKEGKLEIKNTDYNITKKRAHQAKKEPAQYCGNEATRTSDYGEENSRISVPESMPANGPAAQRSLLLELHCLNHLPSRNRVAKGIIPVIIPVLVHYGHSHCRKDVIGAPTGVGICRENLVLLRWTLVSLIK